MEDEAQGENDVAGSDDEVRDELPEDLNASAFVGPYVFPNNNRRRVPGYLYIGIGAAMVLARLVAGADAVLVNGGYLWGGLALIAIGLYHLVAGLNLDVDERDALVAATIQVGFPVALPGNGGLLEERGPEAGKLPERSMRSISPTPR